MGTTGVILVGFVVFHVLGNLLIFQGPGPMDAYSAFLRGTGELLWLARAILIIAVVLHIDAAVQLTLRSRASRPRSYARRNPQASTLAARSMRVGGILLLVFIVFHLLHFTFGTVHPSYPHFDHATVYHNVITGFPTLLLVLFYEVSMLALGLHLYHGIVAMVMSLGISHPHYLSAWRRVATAVAVLVTLGFMSIPAAVYLGWVQ